MPEIPPPSKPQHPGIRHDRVRLVITLYRKEGMSMEDFHTYWREEHSHLFANLTIVKRNLLKYEQVCYMQPRTSSSSDTLTRSIAIGKLTRVLKISATPLQTGMVLRYSMARHWKRSMRSSQTRNTRRLSSQMKRSSSTGRNLWPGQPRSLRYLMIRHDEMVHFGKPGPSELENVGVRGLLTLPLTSPRRMSSGSGPRFVRTGRVNMSHSKCIRCYLPHSVSTRKKIHIQRLSTSKNSMTNIPPSKSLKWSK